MGAYILMRIEELMGRVREARRLREHAQADAGRLMQAALAEVFPRPGAEPSEGWRWTHSGEACQPTERRNPTKSPDMSFVYADISAVDNTEGIIRSPKEMPGREAPSRARKVIRHRDVLFTTTRPYLKNIAMVGRELESATEAELRRLEQAILNKAFRGSCERRRFQHS
jgi:hypothetical protein